MSSAGLDFAHLLSREVTGSANSVPILVAQQIIVGHFLILRFQRSLQHGGDQAGYCDNAVIKLFLSFISSSFMLTLYQNKGINEIKLSLSLIPSSIF